MFGRAVAKPGVYCGLGLIYYFRQPGLSVVGEQPLSKIEYSQYRKSIPQMKYLDDREHKKFNVGKKFCLKKNFDGKKRLDQKIFCLKK